MRRGRVVVMVMAATLAVVLGLRGAGTAEAASLTALSTTPQHSVEERAFSVDVEGTVEGESLLFVHLGPQGVSCPQTPGEVSGDGEWLTAPWGDPVGAGDEMVFVRTLSASPVPAGTVHLCAWLGPDQASLPDATAEHDVLVREATATITSLAVLTQDLIAGRPVSVRVQGRVDPPVRLFVWRAGDEGACPRTPAFASGGEWISPTDGVALDGPATTLDRTLVFTPQQTGMTSLCAWVGDDAATPPRDIAVGSVAVRPPTSVTLTVPPTAIAEQTIPLVVDTTSDVGARMWGWMGPGTVCPDRPSRVPQSGTWLSPPEGTLLLSWVRQQQWSGWESDPGPRVVCAWVGSAADTAPAASARATIEIVARTMTPTTPAPSIPIVPSASTTPIIGEPQPSVAVALEVAGDGESGGRTLLARWSGATPQGWDGGRLYVGADHGAEPCPLTPDAWEASADRGIWLADASAPVLHGAFRGERAIALGPGRGAQGKWRACAYLTPARAAASIASVGASHGAQAAVPTTPARLYTLEGKAVVLRDATGRPVRRISVSSGATSLGLTGDGQLWMFTARGKTRCWLARLDGRRFSCKELLDIEDASDGDDETDGDPFHFWRIGGTGPDTDLLLLGDNLTAGSLRTWRFDPDTEQMEVVASGWTRLSADEGRVARVVHWYRRRGGAFERIAIGPFEGGTRIIRPRPTLKETVWAADFSPDGRQLAAVVTVGSRTVRVLVGTASGTQMRLLRWRGRGIPRTLAWAPDGSAIFVVMETGNRRLIRVPLGGGRAKVIARGVRDVAVDIT